MNVSVFDLFKIGIGPSSSHTVGPMIAACRFASHIEDANLLAFVRRVKVELYGSLGATGKGHGTDRGVMLGLLGDAPDTVDPDTIAERLEAVREKRTLSLLGKHAIPFVLKDHISFYRQALAEHPNGMKFHAFDAKGATLRESTYLSVGGGFVVTAGAPNTKVLSAVEQLPHPFRSGDELLAMCAATGKSVAQLMWENERVWHTEAETREGLLKIWAVMQSSVARGCGIGNPDADGTLPGPFQVKRRAPQLYRALSGNPELALRDPLSMVDWINLYAIAVNEENAAGGRVVTAPTNGAAGIIPAVIRYYREFYEEANEDGIVAFLLTAAAIGGLCKRNASLSGAEVGCQGEVGVACSMAAAGLAAALGGSNAQIENAAEIGIEHHLGMSCDPVGGLVQIPCIERNAMGAVKAINAASLALRGDGGHRVPLDAVIKTMYETGRDMMAKYKETSLGGLAVNVVDC